MSKKGMPLIFWLRSLLVLVLILITVGGITRITNSGLSITEWRPIMGALPPQNEQEWSVEFQKYQQIPQFSALNSAMTIDGFKQIFFWEWLHRLLGRLVGLVAILGWMYLTFSGQLTRRQKISTALIWTLGGLQGAVGWFMVSSGLKDRLYVSELRLLLHLSMAMLIVALIQKHLLDQKPDPFSLNQFNKKWLILASFCIFLIQTFFGVLTAGLKAGYAYNTFPTMNGVWIPEAVKEFSLSNIESVQFAHRWTAVILLAATTLLFWEVRKTTLNWSRSSIFIAGVLVWVQFVLGVLTLLFQVPVVLGALHQLTAFLLFLCLWTCFYRAFLGQESKI